MLERVCELAGLDGIHLDALRQASESDSVIDLGFLNTHPHAIGPFGPPPTALSAAQVARVSELLGQIDLPAVLASLPTEDTEAASFIGHGANKIVGGLRKYLLGHFNALREFYLGASQRHLLLVLWVGLTQDLIGRSRSSAWGMTRTSTGGSPGWSGTTWRAG
ncbi:DUF1877 domain-containing protein [Streptomyces sp. NPDC001286]